MSTDSENLAISVAEVEHFTKTIVEIAKQKSKREGGADYTFEEFADWLQDHSDVYVHGMKNRKSES